MGAIIKCIGLAGEVIAVTTDKAPDGMYLAGYDVEAFEGRGTSSWTENRFDAMLFADHKTAFEIWRKQSETLPLRPDGKPNRPLTAFTVEIESITEHEMYDLLFEQYVHMKTVAVKDGTLAVPFVVNYATTDWLIQAHLPSREPLETVLAELLVHHGPPTWLAFCADGWVKEFHDDPGHLERGQLEEAFNEGDLTVREQLVLQAMSIDQVMYTKHQEYIITDDGDIEFREVTRPRETSGALNDIMTKMVSLGSDEGRGSLFAYLSAVLADKGVHDNDG